MTNYVSPLANPTTNTTENYFIMTMIVFLCIAFPVSSWACTGRYPITYDISKSSVIFTGKVKSIECLPKIKLSPEEANLWHEAENDKKFDIYKVVFSVKETFIGKKSKEITIKELASPLKGQSCAVEKQDMFELDKEYLVYTYGNPETTLTVSAWTGGGCGSTKYLKDASPEELSILRTPGNVFQEIANKKINSK